MRLVNKYQWEGINLLAGIGLALAFSPFDFSFVGIVSLAILFTSWHQISPRRAALRGYLFGIGLFGLGVSWVFVSIYQYGEENIIAAVLLTVIFCSFWAIFPAIAGYISVKLFADKASNSLYVYPIIWILIEYIRGAWAFNGFPWLQISYSQLDTVYAGYIPVLGGYGTGFLIALSAMMICLILRRKKIVMRLWLSILAIALVGHMLKGYQWTHADGKPIKVTLIQGNIPQANKWQVIYKRKILERYKTMTQQHWDSQVIIWPETAIPAYLHDIDEYYLQPLEQQALQYKTDLIVSLPVKNLVNGDYFNAVLALGEQRSLYKKIHLLPFGEYMPLKPLSTWVLDYLQILPVGEFTAGQKNQALLRAGGHPFITTICYEDVFSEVNPSRLVSAAYLVNVTNDGWFGDSIEPYQHMQIARMRALETGRYLLRVTNTGLTGVVSPDGVIIDQLPLFKALALTTDIVPMKGITPIIKIGEFKIVLLLLVAIISLYIKEFAAI